MSVQDLGDLDFGRAMKPVGLVADLAEPGVNVLTVQVGWWSIAGVDLRVDCAGCALLGRRPCLGCGSRGTRDTRSTKSRLASRPAKSRLTALTTSVAEHLGVELILRGLQTGSDRHDFLGLNRTQVEFAGDLRSGNRQWSLDLNFNLGQAALLSGGKDAVGSRLALLSQLVHLRHHLGKRRALKSTSRTTTTTPAVFTILVPHLTHLVEDRATLSVEFGGIAFQRSFLLLSQVQLVLKGGIGQDHPLESTARTAESALSTSAAA